MIPTFLGELIGTMILIIIGCGSVAGIVLKKTKSEHADWLGITVGWGLAVAIAIYISGNFSGAHINPAVTLGMASIGEFPWKLVPMYLIAQFMGAFIGAVIVWIHYLPHWKETKDDTAKLVVFATVPAIRNYWSNLAGEMIAAFVLIFGLLAIGTGNFTAGLNPLVIGGLIVAIGIALGPTTGYAINPARDLAPRLAHALLPIAGKGSSDWKYAWVPVLGPVLGGLLGALLYRFLFSQQVFPLFALVVPISIIVFAGAIIKNVNSAAKQSGRAGKRAGKHHERP